MELFTLKKTVIVKAPLKEVFAFFAKPENLEVITPPELSFKILTPSPVPMHVGSVIHYALNIQGVPFTWVTAIPEYVPNEKFVDVMLQGPYRFWHHTHTFTKTKEGTEIHDRVVYALPYGPLGKLVHSLKVRKQIEGIFNYREQFLKNHSF